MDAFLIRTKRAIDLLLMGLVGGVVVLLLLTRGAPLVGHDALIVRGASMSPAIPLGSLVTVDRSAASRVKVGDIASFKLPTGTVVTHRVVRIVEGAGGRFLEMKGDANQDADPVLVPAEAATGVIGLTIPVLGYVVALLSVPAGILSVLSLIGALVVAGWLIEDMIREGLVLQRLSELRPVRG